MTLEHFKSQGTQALERAVPRFIEQVGSQVCKLSTTSGLSPGQAVSPPQRRFHRSLVSSGLEVGVGGG